ncbi:peptidoglycan editing factor PgeF [Candidatus Epulonipiscium viviparus]|uniref:peptidoglycan editing factor PgeF n=1 Tax=Candidatus Epulonipiscium viviparus TaxID=420336 RepID=UPI00016C01B7|nr:peptidoglycan editing factor PgeF [Candidatus Epulopiscium viviparus]
MFTFKEWEETAAIQAYTTRDGGVSTGVYSSMNMGFSRGDAVAAVITNYKIVADAIGVELESFVASNQTHTKNIRFVKKSDCGNGVTKPNRFTDVDGIYTNEKGITLVTYYADCVPLFFYAPTVTAIGMAHAGWRGTVLEIGKSMAVAFNERFGVPFSEIEVGIGPSICKNCFEVHNDVSDIFMEKEIFKEFVTANAESGKFNIDLWACNKKSLESVGVSKIYVAGECTCCPNNADKFFSHRRDGAERGLAAGLMAIR